MATEQEKDWAGAFGDEYSARNSATKEAQLNAEVFWFKALRKSNSFWPQSFHPSINRVLELGAGAGINLAALRTLLPHAKMHGIEINQRAFAELEKVADQATCCSIFDYTTPAPDFDLVFTKGVLIHIAPADLPRAYEVLYRASKRYILVAEYYNPTPVEVFYRGREERLYKRDFAGEMLAAYPDLHLVDYGFHYHLDLAPQDDINWFLLGKTA